MAPDGMGLQSMEKKSTETFKEDAQGWIEMAAQILPTLTEKEMVATFLTALPSPFYDRMVGNLSTHFAALVMIGEKIEQGVKSGQIADSSTEASKKSTVGNKREGEVSPVTGYR